MADTNEDIAQLLHKMEGLTVALATPLDEEGNLDVSGLNRLMEAVSTAVQPACFLWGGAANSLCYRAPSSNICSRKR